MTAAACLCSFAQRPTLIMPFMKVTTSSGCCSAISAVQVITAGMLAHLQGPVRVPGQVLDGLELAGRLLQVLEGLALGVDRVDGALLERGLQRPERQVVLVVTLEPQLGRVVHRRQHLGLVVPVVGVGELDDLDVVAGHAVHPQHQLDALFLLAAPPVVLDGVQALREADLLPLAARSSGRCRPGRAPACSRPRVEHASRPAAWSGAGPHGRAPAGTGRRSGSGCPGCGCSAGTSCSPGASAGRRTRRRSSCTPPASSQAPDRRCWRTPADSWCSTPRSSRAGPCWPASREPRSQSWGSPPLGAIPSPGSPSGAGCRRPEFIQLYTSDHATFAAA